MRHALRSARALARVVLVCLGIDLTLPGERLGAILIMLNILWIDWLVCMVCRHYPEPSLERECAPPEMDEHSPAAAVAVSYLVQKLRETSSTQAIEDAPARMCLEFLWCLLCLGLTYQAKFKPPKTAAHLTFLNGQFAIALAYYAAPAQADWQMGAKAGAFITLAAYLYAMAPRRPCLIGDRGYLLCFLPALLTDFPVAAAFTAAAAGVAVMADVEMLHKGDGEGWPAAGYAMVSQSQAGPSQAGPDLI